MLLGLYRVKGHSMQPEFKDGDSVFVSSIVYFFKNPKIGDVVLAKNNKTNEIFIKRIVKIEKNKFLLVGDNKEDSLDLGFVERKDIVGKVLLSV